MSLNAASSVLAIPTAEAFEPLLALSRYKAAHGGRGSGKSHFFAEQLVEEAVTGHIRCVGLREHQNSIKDSSKQLLEDKMRALGVAHMFVSTETEIRGPNESLFVFRGLQNHTATSIKSIEGFNRAWGDEAQTFSVRSWELLTPTFRAPGAEMRFSWNPDTHKDAVDKFFRNEDGSPRADDPDIICVRANYTDNPWFEAGMRSDMERDRARDPDKYAHVWLGEYRRNSEARVFRNWRIGELDIPSNARPYFGADWGFSIDPTVLVRCWAWERTLYVDREVYKVGCEIDRTPALFDTMNDERTPDVRQWPIIADSARPETISYMRGHGYPRIESARKGAGSIEDGVEFLKNHDIVVHPRCKHTTDELTMYSYKQDKRTGEILPELDDKANHVIDALRYAVEKLRRHPEAPIVVPILSGVPRRAAPR